MTLASAVPGHIGMWRMSPEQPPGTPLLTVRDLAISRGGRALFDGLGFTVLPGGLLLLRGPNGAGKSRLPLVLAARLRRAPSAPGRWSLLLVLAGVLRPATGTLDWHADEPPKLHFLGHQSGVKSRLSLLENLSFWRAVNGPSGINPPVAPAH